MEKFDRENNDELLEICQIRQYFPVKILCHMVANLQARLTQSLAAVWHHISLLIPFTGSIGPIVQLHGLTGSRKANCES